MSTDKEKPKMLPDRIKLPFFFNPVLLAKDLDLLSAHEWTEHFVAQHFEGSWSVIPLRGPKGETHPIRMSYSDPSQKEYTDTPFLTLTSYFPAVLSALKCPAQSVRLMKLSKNSIIKEHTDFDLSADSSTLRLHIPIITAPEVNFQLNNKRVEMKSGECWYLNLSEPHSVENFSQRDRVHMVIDVSVNKWLIDALYLGVQRSG